MHITHTSLSGRTRASGIAMALSLLVPVACGGAAEPKLGPSCPAGGTCGCSEGCADGGGADSGPFGSTGEDGGTNSRADGGPRDGGGPWGPPDSSAQNQVDAGGDSATTKGPDSGVVEAGTEGGAAASYRVPLDSLPHKRTWMAWPDSTSIWGNTLSGVQADIAGIAKTIAKYEPVYMLANPAAAANAQSLLGSQVTVITAIPIDDCWMRDMGPIFRSDGQGGRDVMGTNFNGWGGKQTHANDALVASRVAAYVGLPFTAAGFTGEGGAIEADGAGTLMATMSSLVNTNRNPGLTQAAVETAVLAAYGATKMIWAPGIVGQDITDDHIDATSRFIDATHAVVQYPLSNDTTVWATDEKQQYQAVSGGANASGVKYATAKIASPNPSAIRQQSNTFVDAYANYYVCNGAVISAQFGDSAADAAAKAALEAAFPGRIVEQLNIDNLGNGGGGIHCVTQQEPAN